MMPENLNTYADSAGKFSGSGTGAEALDWSREMQFSGGREISDFHVPSVADTRQDFAALYSPGKRKRRFAFTEPASTFLLEALWAPAERGFLQHIEAILENRFKVFDFDLEEFKEALASAFTIGDISILLEMVGRRESAERLRALKSCEEELDEGDKPLNPDSVRSYAEFIYLFQGMSEPILGFSPDGILGASWDLAGDRDIGLSFQPDGQVIYAAILPGSDAENPEQMYGKGCCLDVIRALRQRGLNRWVI